MKLIFLLYVPFVGIYIYTHVKLQMSQHVLHTAAFYHCTVQYFQTYFLLPLQQR